MIIGVDARSLLDEHLAGIGTYLDRILKCISSLNVEDTIILYCPREPVNKYEYSSNIRFKVIKGRIGTLWLRYTIPSYLVKDKVEVFWGPEHTNPRPVKGVTYVLTVHDMVSFINHKWSSFITNVMLHLYGKKSIKEADKVISISNSTKNDIKKFVKKVDESKITTIHNGGYLVVNNTKLTKRDIVNKFSISDKYFLFIGTLEPRKNITVVLQAFELFYKEHPDVNLVLAGKIGWKYKNIIDYLDNCSAKDNIKKIGYVSYEEKIVLYQNAISFLFPSRYEGFGLPIIEALSASCPVITNNVSSMPEVGGDAVKYIKDDNDVDGLVRAMNEYYAMNDKERKAYNEKGLKQAAKFTWEKCAERTYKVLKGERDEINK